MKNPTNVNRKSDRELEVTRTFNAPVNHVYRAWTEAELLKKWWTPKSFGIIFVSCEVDVRTGGTYRFVFSHPDFDQPMAFFGQYTVVIPNERIVWTNEEDADGPLTTVTFKEEGGTTLLTLIELYPSKQALDDALANGSTGTSAAGEQFDSLDELLTSAATA